MRQESYIPQALRSQMICM